MMDYLGTRAPYLSFVALMVMGTYMLLTHRHLLRSLVGLTIFQSSIILFYILLAGRPDATAPILAADGQAMVNPLPHALMLTAIVVGVATQGVGLALLHRIRDEVGHWKDEDMEGDDE